MSSYRLFNRVKTRLVLNRFEVLQGYVYGHNIRARSFVKRQNHTTTTTDNMSLLQHTGPSALYTELAELPFPVSADFVGGDGASVNIIRDR